MKRNILFLPLSVAVAGGSIATGALMSSNAMAGAIAAQGVKAGDRVAVMMDGGVRSGVDVVKALAAGARAVMIGRPWIWALAGRGRQGLAALLKTFKSEMNVAMALTATPAIADIDGAVIDRGADSHNEPPGLKIIERR